MGLNDKSDYIVNFSKDKKSIVPYLAKVLWDHVCLVYASPERFHYSSFHNFKNDNEIMFDLSQIFYDILYKNSIPGYEGIFDGEKMIVTFTGWQIISETEKVNPEAYEYLKVLVREIETEAIEFAPKKLFKKGYAVYKPAKPELLEDLGNELQKLAGNEATIDMLWSRNGPYGNDFSESYTEVVESKDYSTHKRFCPVLKVTRL